MESEQDEGGTGDALKSGNTIRLFVDNTEVEREGNEK